MMINKRKEIIQFKYHAGLGYDEMVKLLKVVVSPAILTPLGRRKLLRGE